MSTLYEVTVQEIEDEKTAVLHIQVVHPDSMYITDTPGFCLMLLWEGADGEGPLSGEIDLDTVLDEGWLKKYARGFISRSEIVSLQNEPPKEAFDDYEHAYWNDSAKWMFGTVRIEVTDPAWISTLSKGKAWDSTAFEPNTHYAKSRPILHEEATADADRGASVDDKAGLIPVPRVFFLDYLSLSTDDYIWFPKYSEKAYVADTVYEDAEITEALLDSFVGKVVWYSSWGDGVGVLMPDHQVVYISSGSRGSSGLSVGSGKIGLARFNTKKKRLANPLSIEGMSESAGPVVHKVTIDGDTAIFTIHCYDPERQLILEHEGNALALLAAAECDTFDGLKNAESRFGKWLHQKSEEAGINFADQIFAKFGKGIVTKFSLNKTKAAKKVDWKKLEGDALIDKLKENPWTIWTAKISVTDPEFLKDLPSLTPFSFNFNWIEKVEACDPLSF